MSDIFLRMKKNPSPIILSLLVNSNNSKYHKNNFQTLECGILFMFHKKNMIIILVVNFLTTSCNARTLNETFI